MSQPYQKEWFQMAPGVKRRILSTGDKVMAVHVHFEPGASVAQHAHPHEQISYCIKGNINFNVNGESVPMTQGESYLIPGNIQHSATAVEETLLLETFSPPREDFLASLQQNG